jgi:hypothetical protein
MRMANIYIDADGIDQVKGMQISCLHPLYPMNRAFAKGEGNGLLFVV